MPKCDYSMRIGTKQECKEILDKYHYLSKESRGFKTKENYILSHSSYGNVGVCIFTGFPVKELFYSMFGLRNNRDQNGFYELSRLCLDPSIQQNEHNIASWFVSRCIKDLRSRLNVRSILSYADSRFHKGTVYQSLGFLYCGLTDAKKDFWFELPDGSYRKHSRGSVRNCRGEWRDRPRKHRYVKVYDNTLKLQWDVEKYVKENQ
jgi:hypothetical protein